MSRLTVNSVLCHAQFSHEFSPGITLVTGKNTSGKTSVARIMAALTAHDSNPAHVSATQGKLYVQDGALEGEARLDDVVWRPPSGISTPPGMAPPASPHAVGLVDFVRGNRSPKERAKLWEGLFLPDDPMAILKDRWPLPESQLAVVVNLIQEQGWEAASTIYDDRRKDAKRRWSAITGQQYGPKKAVEWVPPNWRTELEGASEKDLEAANVDLRDRIQQLGVQQTVEQSKIDEAREIVATEIPRAEHDLQEVKKQVAVLEEQFGAARKRLEEARDQKVGTTNEIRRLTQVLEARAPHQCPHCQGGLTMEGGTVKAWEKPSPKFLDEAQEARETLRQGVERLDRELPILNSNHDELSTTLLRASSQASQYEGRLQELQRRSVLATAEPSQSNDAERARLELALEEAQKNLIAYQSFYKAKREHDNIVELDAVCSLLGPTGARAQHMRSRMDNVRLVLKNAHAVTEWEEITILDDYSISSNGRPITLCAQNEQLKAQYLCQIAACMLGGSEWLVLDQADLLKDESGAGLITLLNRLATRRPNLHAVVCATSTPCPDGWDHVRLD